ncbi:MAG TPA: sigma-70 family RNA polymerase sigma factor, partial [Kofleriaceae bacterium]|nr:sigma-70 family RNA polymerase sigma factor [Kofleriaceae bacterium]
MARRPTEPLDEVTLRRAQRGDQRAWRDLIDRYQQPVHSLIWRLLAGRARHRVEDLTQETFVRVLRALPGFDPSGPASLSTWILTIAARLALNELRRPEAAAIEREPIGRDRTDADAERRRIGAAIAAGVAELSDDHRAVFVL